MDSEEENPNVSTEVRKENTPIEKELVEQFEKNFFSKITQKEIDSVYHQSNSNQGSLYSQIILICSLLLFVSFETQMFHFSTGVNSVNQYQIESGTPNVTSYATFQNITNKTQILEWLQTVTSRLYTNTQFQLVYPNSSFEFGTITYPNGTQWSLQDQMRNQTPSVPNSMLAQYATFIENDNYFVGMRINILTSQKKIPGGIFANVIGFSKIYPSYEFDQNVYNYLNQSSFNITGSNLVFRPAGSATLGYYGTGFVLFMPGNISLAQVQQQLAFLNLPKTQANSNDFIIMAAEYMFYNRRLETGHNYIYELLKSNNGVFSNQITRTKFQPVSNFWSANSLIIKICCMIIVLIVLFINTIIFAFQIKEKFRMLFQFKTNQFYAVDLVQACQQIVGYICVGYYIFLYFSPSFTSFQLPLQNETQFQLWSDWGFGYQNFTIFLAAFIFLAIMMVLMLLSIEIPSLSIIFLTIQKAKSELFYFSITIVLSMITVSAGFSLVFGDQEPFFNTVSNAFMMNYWQLLGDFQYDLMYAANPQNSVYMFCVFVFFFCFLTLNMYNAIIVRNYLQLIEKKQLLSNAVTRLLKNQFDQKGKILSNCLFCVDPYKNEREYEKSELKSKKGSKVVAKKSCGEICSLNLSNMTHKHVETKDQFMFKLRECCLELYRENEERKQQIKIKFHATDKTQRKHNYIVMKRGLFLIVYLIISIASFSTFLNSQDAGQCNSAISQWMLDNQYTKPNTQNATSADQMFQNIQIFDDIVAYSTNFVDMVSAAKQREGRVLNTFPGLDIYRVTFNLYDNEINYQLSSQPIFATVASPFTLNIVKPQPIDYVMNYLMANDNPQAYDIQVNNYNFPYVNTSNFEDSSLGTGGFVFTFNASTYRDVVYNLTLPQLMNLNWYNYAIAEVSFEVVNYNSNYDLLTLNTILFQCKGNGAISTDLFQTTLNPQHYFKPNILVPMVLYFIFSAYYLVDYVQQLFAFEKKKTQNEEEKHKKKQKFGKQFFMAIGLDQNVIQREQKCVAGIRVIGATIKYIFKGTLAWIQHIIKFSFHDLYALISTLSISCTIVICCIFIQILILPPLVFNSNGRSNNLTYSLSIYAQLTNQLRWLCSFNLFWQMILSLQVLRFSPVLNMPMSIIQTGIKDILNFLFIFFFVTTALAYIGFIMFSTISEDFNTIHTSMITILYILMSNFSMDVLFIYSPYQSTVYIFAVCIMLKQIMFWIFLGIIYSHFIEEYRIYIEEKKPQHHFIFFYLKATIRQPFKIWNDNRKQKLIGKGNKPDDDQQSDPKSQSFFDKLEKALDYTKLDLRMNESEDKQRQNDLATSVKKIGQLQKIEHHIKKVIKEELELMEINQEERKELIDEYKNNTGMRYFRNHYSSQNKDLNLMREVETDPEKIVSILNLNDKWKEAGEEHEKTNSNFWVHHLETQLAIGSKKQVGLFDFKLDEDDTIYGFTDAALKQFAKDRKICKEEMLKMPKKQQVSELNFLIEKFATDSQKIDLLKDRNQSSEKRLQIKFGIWKFLDHKLQTLVIHDVLKLLKAKEKKKNDKVVVTSKSVLESNPHMYFASSVFGLTDIQCGQCNKRHNRAESSSLCWENDSDVHQLRYQDVIETNQPWLYSDLHQVKGQLLKLWDELTYLEKFKFFFILMDSNDRVRFWNSLTFPLSAFSKVVEYAETTQYFIDKETKIMPRKDINVMIQKLIRGDNKNKNPSRRYSPIIMRQLWIQLTQYYSDAESLSQLKKFDKERAEPLTSRNYWQLLPRNKKNPELNMDKQLEWIQKQIMKDRMQHQNLNKQQKHDLNYFEGGEREEELKTERSERALDNNNQEEKKQNKDLLRENGLPEIQNSVPYGPSMFIKQAQNDQTINFLKILVENVHKCICQLTNDYSSYINEIPSEKSKYGLSDEDYKKFKIFQCLMSPYTEQEGKIKIVRNDETFSENLKTVLWVMLSEKDRLKMFIHQNIKAEQSIMAALLEFPLLYRASDINFNQSSIVKKQIDLPLEKILNGQIFFKYIGLTRLEATKRAYDLTKKRQDEMDIEDQNLIDYTVFIMERYKSSGNQLSQLLIQKDKQQIQNSAIKERLLSIMQNLQDGMTERQIINKQGKSSEIIQQAMGYYQYTMNPEIQKLAEMALIEQKNILKAETLQEKMKRGLTQKMEKQKKKDLNNNSEIIGIQDVNRFTQQSLQVQKDEELLRQNQLTHRRAEQILEEIKDEVEEVLDDMQNHFEEFKDLKNQVKDRNRLLDENQSTISDLSAFEYNGQNTNSFNDIMDQLEYLAEVEKLEIFNDLNKDGEEQSASYDEESENEEDRQLQSKRKLLNKSKSSAQQKKNQDSQAATNSQLKNAVSIQPKPVGGNRLMMAIKSGVQKNDADGIKIQSNKILLEDSSYLSKSSYEGLSEEDVIQQNKGNTSSIRNQRPSVMVKKVQASEESEFQESAMSSEVNESEDTQGEIMNRKRMSRI